MRNVKLSKVLRNLFCASSILVTYNVCETLFERFNQYLKLLR
jgi:hypothetical protein